jgi:alkanesulfonate monooxygenase SsuD/methylene tetrahydromethanopterin reductase-like flavin-dependent oxidoreductase (luciferase family)
VPVREEQLVTKAKRQMSLVGFMQAGSTTVYAGSWRHPATEHGFLDASYYAKLGRTLEEGCFDMMFFDDRLAMPGIYGGSVAEAVRLGARPVKLDLSIVLGVIAGVTERIGLGATYSTTYYSPFHVARTFATLDHLSGGRAAWNIVTSVNDSEAQNYGFHEHLGHDVRYDRADEFLEVTTGLRVLAAPGHRARIPGRVGHGPRQRVLRGPRQGARAGSRGQVVHLARSSHGAAQPAGPPGAAPGGLVGAWSPVRRALGRADLHGRS